MKSTEGKKKQKTKGKKSRKEPKSDMLMSENMEQELTENYRKHHGAPDSKQDIYHKKVSTKPEK